MTKRSADYTERAVLEPKSLIPTHDVCTVVQAVCSVSWLVGTYIS